MKLFNWIHRKSSQEDVSSENAKKDCDQFDHVTTENESFGDDHHVFDDWKGGILTIGTFGYHQLEDIENEKKSSVDYFSVENDESDQMTDDDEEDDEEMNHPLLEMKNSDSDQISLTDDCDEINKERTTLADLFYAADSVKLDEKLPEEKGVPIIKEKMNMNKKHGLLFSKKKHDQEEPSRPIQKLNRMMRKMLKRKIHPDLGYTKDNPNDDKVRAKICGENEATSFLSIPQG